MAMRGATAASAAHHIRKIPIPSALLHFETTLGKAKSNFLASTTGISSNPQIAHPELIYPIRAAHGTAAKSVAPGKEYEEEPAQNWKIKMLYDGDCPLCMREVNMLRERNKLYGAIKFVDISSNKYSPEDNQGLDYEIAMGRIHAVLADGTVVRDVEAFRRLYEEVGLGWVYAITKYKPIAKLADVVYGIWAKYRLQITGRPPLEQILEERKEVKVCDDSKVCKM